MAGALRRFLVEPLFAGLKARDHTDSEGTNPSSLTQHGHSMSGASFVTRRSASSID
jgi:hypothetical protein